MKFSYVSIFAVMCIVIAVAVAGCTSQSTTTSGASSGSSSSSSGSSSSAAATSTPQVGATVSSSSVFGSSYAWVEYKTTATSSGGNEISTDMKSVVSTGTYQGQAAKHTLVTITTSTGTSLVNDYYYDTAMTTLLGGTMTLTYNGKTTTTDLSSAQLSQASELNYHSSSPLTFAGVESVTVPAGTYPAASKYTKTDNGDTVTFWSAPGIPVPVQITTSSSYSSSTSQLEGWG